MAVDVRTILPLLPLPSAPPVTISALTGGITNVNYRLDAGEQSFVLRIGGHRTALLGIDRDCEYRCSLAAARLGVGPEVYGFFPEYDALLTRFVTGRVLDVQDGNRPEVIARVAKTLRRYHAGPGTPGRFSPFETIRSYHAIARQYHVILPPALDRALDHMTVLEAQPAPIEPPVPCHNDLLPANCIDDGRTVWIIDWEYAGMGDRLFDLGNLAANFGLSTEHEELLAECYFCRRIPEQLGRIRTMRRISELREALWGFLQAGISTLDFDFLDYGRLHLDRFLAADSEPSKSAS